MACTVHVHVRIQYLYVSIQGPVLRTWYLALDRIVGPSRTTKDALKKVFLDQVVFAPVLFLVLLPLFGYSQGMNTVQVKEKVKEVNFDQT